MLQPARSTMISAFALFLCITTNSVAAQPSDNELGPAARKEVLRTLAAELEARYVFPDTAAQLAAFVRAKQKSNAYRNVSSGFAFAKTLTDDLYTVAHDKHLRVTFSFGPLPREAPPGPTPDDLEWIRKENASIVKLEILDGNVGYVRINGFSYLEGARPVIDTAFAFVHNTDALIIDARGNYGGDAKTVTYVASYLSEGEPHLAGSFHYREGNKVTEFWTQDLGALSYGAKRPVFVLTSSMTFSGGEGLAYDLQARHRAVIVGEVTGGGATSPKRLPLGHQLLLAVPVAYGEHPITKGSWEGTGVQPDVSIDAAAAMYKAHALAIEKLRASKTDPWEQSDLDSVAMKIQVLGEMQSGQFTRLSNAQLFGSYSPIVGAGTTFVIFEKDGKLLRHVDGFPDRALVYRGGNRYGQEELPEGFAISFRARDGRTELLLEESGRPSVIRAKN